MLCIVGGGRGGGIDPFAGMDMFSKASKSNEAKKASSAGDGEWICEKCQNVNKKGKSECSKCHAAAPKDRVFLSPWRLFVDAEEDG